MGISKILTADHGDTWDSASFAQANKQELLDACTDWIGPYMVRKGLEPTDVKPEFTGGWHAIKDYEVMTAKTISYRLDKSGLTVINRIMGYNTVEEKEYILEEEVTYTMTNGRLAVEARTKALTDCTIERYYGLQSQNSLHMGQVVYNDSEEKVYRVDESSFSKPYTGVEDKAYTVYSEDGKHRLDVDLDEGYGLGTGEYVAENQAYAFTLSYKKSYFNLVHSKELSMKKGEVIKWRGEYRLTYIQQPS